MNNTTNKNQKITPTDASDDDENEEILGFSPNYDIFPLVLAIVIVVCNTLVLRLIIGVKSLRTGPNFILGSLAFSDLLSGVPGIPLYLACSAVQTTIVCGITQVLTRFFSISVVLHLILVSIDRYVAVTRAMRYRSLVTKRKAIFSLFFVWTAAAFVALIQLSWVGLDVDVNKKKRCFHHKDEYHLRLSLYRPVFYPTAYSHGILLLENIYCFKGTAARNKEEHPSIHA